MLKMIIMIIIKDCDSYFELMAIFDTLRYSPPAHEGVPTKKYTRVKLKLGAKF